jgi:hypothetical protein
MILNASLGFFIYCIMCNDFRRDFARFLAKLKPRSAFNENSVELETLAMTEIHKRSDVES